METGAFAATHLPKRSDTLQESQQIPLTVQQVYIIRWESWTLAEEADLQFRRVAGIVAASIAILAWFLSLFQWETKRMPVGTYDGVRYSVKLAEHVDPLPPRESPRSVSEAPEKLHLATTPKAPRKPVNTPATDPAASADAEKVLGTRVIRNQPREIRDQNFNTISTQQPLVSSMASSKGVAAKDNSAGRSDAANSDGMVNGAPRLQVGPPSDHRDLDEIRRVFERNKWPLAVLYDYAVREHPSMGVGRIVVRLTVAPGGAVVDCLLVSSTFAAPDFERRIVSQIRLFRFPSENAFQFTFPAYPIDFQPE